MDTVKQFCILLLSLFACTAYSQNPEAGEPRHALVIGNSDYKSSPLRNPVNDADDVAAALEGLGFRVTKIKNGSARQMRESVEAFARQLRMGGVGLFFYAGHGVQSRGRNFLLPVNANITSEADLEYESLDSNLVLGKMDEAGNRVNMIILDACRDNPFTRSFRNLNQGLAQMEAAKGSLIAFATGPGSVAADGTGRNGLYTQHLLNSLKHPDSDVDKVFRRVAAGVAKASGNKQIPWKSDSLTGDFQFRPGGDVKTAAAQPNVLARAAQRADERVLWESVKDSNNVAELQAFVERFPEGIFAGVIKVKLKELTTSKPSVQVAMASPTTEVQMRAAQRADERVLWESVKDSNNVAELQAFLERFPEGIFAGVIRVRLKELTTSTPPIRVATASQTLDPNSKKPQGTGVNVVPVRPNVPDVQAEQRANELAQWEAVKDSSDVTEFQAFLDQFPNGKFANVARERQKTLTAVNKPVQLATAPATILAARPESITTLAADLSPGKTFRDCDVCPEMVVIAAGRYTMGGDISGSRPPHPVNFSRHFAAGKFEVTFDEWDACVSERGCAHTPADQNWGRGKRPVINVSWDDVKQYVAWLSSKTGHKYKLLSEAEWEYVARAGTVTEFNTGNRLNPTQANYDVANSFAGSIVAVSQEMTVDVGSYPANAFGLHDVHGNVWEWTEDCWNGNYNGAPEDGGARISGNCGERVLRGGSWGNFPQYLRTAIRHRESIGLRSNSVGLRVARTF